MRLVFLNLLETIRAYKKRIKVYQASTSELYGLIQEKKQNEKTPFYPRKSLRNFKIIFLLDLKKL